MSNTYTEPTLSYLSSVDLSSSNGSSLYTVQFDENMVSDGNILMFEYKIQEYTLADLNPIPNDENVTLGFVNLENCNFNSGISNIWQISVPALESSGVLRNMCVRVYVGLSDSTRIVVSAWSNALRVYNPPAQPILSMAYYDSQSLDNADDLFLLVNVDPLLSSDNKYIVAYYYTNDADDVVWAVSDQVAPTEIMYSGNNYNLLTVSAFGKVSQTSNVVYAAVYCVLPFSHNSKAYYSVSKISNTLGANPSVIYNAPTLTSVDYSYSLESSDIAPMVINWEAPLSAVVDTFQVQKYILYVSLNGGSWSVVSDNVPSEDRSYTFDVSDYSAGDNLNFKLQAVSEYNTASPDSNQISKYTFKFSNAPLDLEVVTSSYDDVDGVSLSFNFKNPLDTGYGAGVEFLVTVSGSSSENDVTELVAYNANSEMYTVILTNMNISSSGSISVCLRTQDTNSSGLLDGYTVETSYISANFVVDDISYEVYNLPNNSQDMTVSWSGFNDFVVDGWSVDNYQVYLEVTGNNPEDEQLISTTTDSSLVYSATQNIGNTLSFRITAHLVKDLLSFSINSSSLTKNIFKYPTICGGLGVDYATILVDNNDDEIGINLSIFYTNNANTSSTLSDYTQAYWVGEVYDNTYNPNNVNNFVQQTQLIPYDVDATQNTMVFSNLPYFVNGYVNVYLVVPDTNSLLFLNGSASYIPFSASKLPKPQPPTVIEGTNVLLLYINTLTHLTPSASLWTNNQEYPFNIEGKYTLEINQLTGNLKYIFTLDPVAYGFTEFPPDTYLIVSNATGPVVSSMTPN
jgi:hypothetical protein